MACRRAWAREVLERGARLLSRVQRAPVGLEAEGGVDGILAEVALGGVGHDHQVSGQQELAQGNAVVGVAARPGDGFMTEVS